MKEILIMIRTIAHTRGWMPVIPFLFLLFFTGCIRDESALPTPPESEKSEIGFSLQVPGTQIPFLTTKGMAGAPESDLKTIDLLVYEKGGTDPDSYYFRERVSLPEEISYTQNGSSVEFKVKLGNRSNSALVMVIANAKDFLDDRDWLLKSENNKTKKELLDNMRYDLPSGVFKWNTGDGYTPIPMYGETELPKGISPGIVSVPIVLTRMLARIDVQNSADNFTLNKVYLVDYYTGGKISPAYGANGEIIGGNPSIYMEGTPKRRGWDQAASYPYTEGTDGGMQGEIYAFESTLEDSAPAFLILEGKLAGDDNTYYYRVDFTVSTGTNPSEIEKLPLKRNFRYIVNIRSANGIGYATPQEAAEATSASAVSNLETALLTYDQSALNNIVYNGQYFLGSNESDVVFDGANYGDGIYDRSVSIYTNAPDPGGRQGWFATIDEGDNWLTFADYWNVDWGGVDPQPIITNVITGPSNIYNEKELWNPSRIMIKAQGALPIGMTTRSGRIKVTANSGRLVLYINVTQTDTGLSTGPFITLLDENGDELPFTLHNDKYKLYTLEFGLHVGGSVPSKRIYVKTSETNGFRLFQRNMDGGTSYITYDPSFSDPYPVPQGIGRDSWDNPTYYWAAVLVPFDIRPLRGLSGEEKWDMFTFQANNDDKRGADLTIYQGDWIEISEFDVKQYLLGNVTYSAKITATTPWRISKITETRTAGPEPGNVSRFLLADKNADNYLKVGATGGAGATPVDKVTTDVDLTTAQWLKGLEGLRGRVTVEFESVTPGAKPTKAFTFDVFEHHQDYTTANANTTPLFYTFPINYPRTDAGVWPFFSTTWTDADAACRTIGPGWRLPTYTEAYLFSVYNPALVNAKADRDEYAEFDTEQHGGWYDSDYWTLGKRDNNGNYGTMNPFTGYSGYAASSSELMARCVYTRWASGEPNPTFNVNNLPNIGGKHYPYIDISSSEGPIIVSRDNDGGVNSSALGTPSSVAGGGIFDAGNVVAAKLQVANTDIKSSSSGYYLFNRANGAAECLAKGGGWRLPTQKEMLLIFALGGSQFHNNTTIGNGFAKLSELRAGIGPGSGFTLLSANYSYWTSSNDGTDAWTIGMAWGEGLPIDPATEGEVSVGTGTVFIAGVRCVQTVP